MFGIGLGLPREISRFVDACCRLACFIVSSCRETRSIVSSYRAARSIVSCCRYLTIRYEKSLRTRAHNLLNREMELSALY